MKGIQKKLGIAIDEKLVRVVELVWNRGRVSVEGAISLVSSSTDETALGNTLSQALKELGSPKWPASFAISEKSFAFELVALPPLKGSDQQKAVHRNALRIANTPPDRAKELQIGWRKTRTVEKAEGSQEEYLIFTSPQSMVQKILALAQHCDLELEAILPYSESLWAANKISAPLAINEAELLIDFGNSFTHLCLLSQGQWLYSRDLAKTIHPQWAFSEKELRLGKTSLTTTEPETVIVENLSNESDSAGVVGAAHAPPLPATKNTEANPILPPLLLGEIRRTILFLEREFNLRLSKIVLSGSIRPMEGLLEELSAKLERSVTWPQDERMESGTATSSSENPYPSAYAAPIGAALGTFELDLLNLLPIELRPQKGSSMTRLVVFSGGIAAILLVGSWTAMTWAQIPGLRENIESSKPFAKRALEAEQEQKPMSGEMKKLLAHGEALKEIRKNRSPIPFVLEELSRAIPPSLALNQTKVFRDHGRWVFRCEGTVIEHGSLKTVLGFQKLVQTLKNSPLFDQVEYSLNVQTPKHTEQGKSPETTFWIAAFLKGVAE